MQLMNNISTQRFSVVELVAWVNRVGREFLKTFPGRPSRYFHVKVALAFAHIHCYRGA